MSQSYLPDWKPGEFDAAVPSLAELESPRAAQPGQAAAPGHVAGVPSIAALDADAIRRDAEQAALEAKHGKLGTAGMHYARGVLSAVLSPGAYAGAGLESLGSAAGWQGLEDFGRGLGESATGQAAMEAAAFMLGSGVGGEQEGLSDYDRMRRDVQESQQAWPMLSMLSSAAGMATVGVLTGGSSAATTLGGRAAAMGTVGAVEGGGAGAQAAYEQSAPLRDVLSSAVIGAALGGALGGGATAAGGALMRGAGGVRGGGVRGAMESAQSAVTGADREVLERFGALRFDESAKAGRALWRNRDTILEESTKELTERVNDVAKRSSDVFDEVVDSSLKREHVATKLTGSKPLMLKTAQEEAERLRSDMQDIFRKDVDARTGKVSTYSVHGNDALVARVDEYIEGLSSKIAGADDPADAFIALDQAKRGLQKWTKTLRTSANRSSDALQSSNSRTLADKLDAMQERTRQLLMEESVWGKAGADQKTINAAWEKYFESNNVFRTNFLTQTGTDYASGRAITVADPRKVSGYVRGLGRQEGKLVDEHFRAHVQSTRELAEAVENAFDLGPKRAAVSSVRDSAEAIRQALARADTTVKVANQIESVIAAERAVGSDLALGTVGGGILGGIPGAMAGAVAGAVARPGGAIRRLASIEAMIKRAGVSVQRAGGREAKEVIDELAGLKGSVRKAIADAGDNPEVRFAAERAARAAAAEELGKKAGSYNVAKWDKSTPTPVQKVLFRRELLDRASQDLASDFKATSALRPPTDFDIDPGRLGKLLRDADGPEAIGALQQRVLAAAKEAPPTPLGDALRYRIGQSRAALAEADLPGSMVEGHKLLRDLEKAAQSAPDELTRSYVARTAAALSDDLGSQAFGSAGQLYRSLRPDQTAFEALGSADLLRNALRTTAERGKLPELVAQYGAQLEAAVTAAKKLGSPSTVKGLQKQLRALEARFAAAEEAVTLDGGPIARVLDFFEGGLDGKMAASVAPGASLETMVGDTVRGKMETLLPALKAPQQGRYRPGATRAAAAVTSRLTVAEQHELYRERVQLLGQAQGTNGAEVAELAMEGMPPGTPAGLAAVIGADFSSKLATLAAEIPRPKPDIRGKAFETLSSDDVRRANAMFEATTDPLSVFDDFRAGSVDYDKVTYAWRQYPGLKQAAQLALVDAFQEHLSDEDKAAIPDGTITQLDYLLGFDGTLQPTLEPGFSARMDQIGAELAAQAAQQQAQRKALELPSAKPSYTERVGGASA